MRERVNKVSIQRYAPTDADVPVVRATKHQSWIVIIYLLKMIADRFFLYYFHTINPVLFRIGVI